MGAQFHVLSDVISKKTVRCCEKKESAKVADDGVASGKGVDGGQDGELGGEDVVDMLLARWTVLPLEGVKAC
jgi:hypothetical protein